MAAKDQIESIFSGSNGAYLADLYAQWVENPESVDASFSDLFTMLDDAHNIIVKDARGASWSPRPLTDILLEADEKLSFVPKRSAKISNGQLYVAVNDSIRAIELMNAYRVFGHQYAELDPLQLTQRVLVADLDPKTYGFTTKDMDRPIFVGKNGASFLTKEIHTLNEIIAGLQKVYCRSIAWEYMYLQDLKQRHWLMQRIENLDFITFSNEDKKRVLQQVTEAVGLENFCQKRYVGVKRFGLDGGEVTIPALHALIRQAVQYDVRSITMGMAHRGRLNVLTNVIGKSFASLFREFSGGSYKPEGIPGAADVKYHLGYRKIVEVAGKEIELSMAFNPSHLEAVGAVVEGQVRAEQDRNAHKHLAVILHGDAAFAGQGVVYEVLAMSQLPAYQTGGSIHIVINNQIGFTTVPEESSSGYYSTDIAKVARAPIIHVNGDDPEAVVKVMQLAVEFRERFATDVVVDLVCYRRHGHNETDEPIFTQPVMTQAIRKHDNLYKVYADKLAKEGVISFADSEANWNEFQEYLQEGYVVAQNYHANEIEWIAKEWQEMKFRGQDRQNFSTAISYDMAQKVGKALSSYAEGFDCHPKLIRQLEAKAQMFLTGTGVDWATAEALAFGSLLVEGYPVRLTGQDCQRGTFSHRNAVLFDQKTQQPHILLNHIQPEQAKIDIYNSHLSEFAVLGFEYGYSCTNANALVLWEAQFGDFVNSAQIIIDQFISAGESKWLQMSGLVMLLPHAQEGQGAEHSSARLERFLQLCAEDNMQICNLTTPANYFHALRRQLKRNYRQPLVVMSPKSLLRHKLAQSPLSAFIDQTQFLPVIDEVDPAVTDKEKIKRVVICSGKVYYDLFIRRLELRCELQSEQIALIRLEQFYPFPTSSLAEVLISYPNAEMVWCQEEPENMGGWNFIDRKIEKILREMYHKTSFVKYVGRLPAASPATGLASVYKAEQATLLDQALGHLKV